MAKKENRFVRVYSQGSGWTTPACYVLVDKQTGVNYLYASGGYGGGITPLLNRDGTPVITPIPKDYSE